jgi:hypothetical protein
MDHLILNFNFCAVESLSNNDLHILLLTLANNFGPHQFRYDRQLEVLLSALLLKAALILKNSNCFYYTE